ncbi:WbqC family protein [Methanosarcina sp. KYL-1]|uniref:WbqC family protein n=1 Tax=Methanosarcina sp. KYL-1 TaxID=2602068 RepID=UPI002100A397|nr:WbqC family protein [Methanosarcina sp. KYL-1]MCQ1535494.1 WbqC family protein [Methanosarcina sp. KYL-1]
MIVGIHQPNYLPYMGFVDKLKKSDVFIIYDDAQFSKGDFQHRNRIRIHHGWEWLTVPVEKKHIPINQIKIKNNVKISGMNWQEAHFKEIHDNYRKAPYYPKYEKDIQRIYEQQYDVLIDINMELIEFLMKSFDIATEIIYSSEFGFNSKSTEKLVDLVSAVEGDVYLSGPMGKNYLEHQLFEEKNIHVTFQEFKHPAYQQQYNGFEPNMSAIDSLFNDGRIP